MRMNPQVFPKNEQGKKGKGKGKQLGQQRKLVVEWKAFGSLAAFPVPNPPIPPPDAVISPPPINGSMPRLGEVAGARGANPPVLSSKASIGMNVAGGSGLSLAGIIDEDGGREDVAVPENPRVYAISTDENLFGEDEFTELFSGVRLRLTNEDVTYLEILNDGRPVGYGGFCDMFQGVDKRSGLKLAMKRPRMLYKYGGSVEVVRRFQREAETWSGLDHDNILPFIGLVEIRAELYMVSPWTGRGDLYRFLTCRSKHLALEQDIPQNTRIGVHIASFDEKKTIHGIASGLAYLHSQNYVHGDIKSENVLLEEDGNPLLCDFGLTKFSGCATSTEMMGIGSARWMAPELLNRCSKSIESDVYAFAMVIVEILTGALPFPDLANVAVVAAVLYRGERPPLSPPSRQGHDFTQLWYIASRCWEKEPEMRPSMNEALSQLQLIID